jgi:hypothetical protein
MAGNNISGSAKGCTQRDSQADPATYCAKDLSRVNLARALEKAAALIGATILFSPLDFFFLTLDMRIGLSGLCCWKERMPKVYLEYLKSDCWKGYVVR